MFEFKMRAHMIYAAIVTRAFDRIIEIIGIIVIIIVFFENRIVITSNVVRHV